MTFNDRLATLCIEIYRNGTPLSQPYLPFEETDMTDLSRVKATGQLREDGEKDYLLLDKETGQSVIAVKVGQKYTVYDSPKLTLKECKIALVEGNVVDNADEESDILDDLTNALFGESKELWSCCHPAALLVLIRSGVDVPESVINETLASYGYDTDDALVDAKQVYNHHTNETL